MTDWSASHYLRYGDERTRPAEDLTARIGLRTPHTIADLGCGPGNSTQVLCARWPNARVLGVDNSPEMIAAARHSYPEQDWLLANISNWTPAAHFDLIFSNAALQWLPDHAPLLQRLIKLVAVDGALAFQVPSSTYAAIRTLVHEVSRDPAWNGRMNEPRNSLTMEAPAFYYDALVADTTVLDIWETEYHHVMTSRDALIDWMASTGLRPFLAALDDDPERNVFLDKLRRRLNEAYEIRADGKVLFPFRRTFVIAYR